MAYSFIHVVYVPTKHIAYFLSFFLCLFSFFFLFICRCSLALSRTLQVSKHGHSTTTSALESNLYFIYRFHVISISYCIMTLLCRLSVEHVYLCYVLTMRVFTTSWWVVNQLIVMVIFLYAFYILMLVCIRPFEAWHLMVYVIFTVFIAYWLSGLCSRD